MRRVTYPAWKVNGFMVSGYPTPDTGKNFTYPPELAKETPPLVEDAAFFKFEVQRTVPGTRRLREQQRRPRQPVLQARLSATVAELREEIPVNKKSTYQECKGGNAGS